MAWTHHIQHSWADRLQHLWADHLPRKDAICHAVRAQCLVWVHPNRAPAFNPPHKAGKHCSTFCSEEEGIRTSGGLFRNSDSEAKNALMRRRTCARDLADDYLIQNNTARR